MDTSTVNIRVNLLREKDFESAWVSATRESVPDRELRVASELYTRSWRVREKDADKVKTNGVDRWHKKTY